LQFGFLSLLVRASSFFVVAGGTPTAKEQAAEEHRHASLLLYLVGRQAAGFAKENNQYCMGKRVRATVARRWRARGPTLSSTLSSTMDTITT
jgi:hypothetical protein